MKPERISEEELKEYEGAELVIKVQNQSDWEQEVVEDLRNNKNVPTLSFENPDDIADILKKRTQKIIQEIKDNPPESIRDLSRKSGIGLREVHEDLKLLERNGIIYIKESKGKKKPRIPYSKITYQILGDEEKPRQPEPA